MTIQDVQVALNNIRDSKDDDEVAHSMEDDLHQAVLLAIADGTAEEPKIMARLALESLNINFSRWCA